jgi:hypothetical protein
MTITPHYDGKYYRFTGHSAQMEKLLQAEMKESAKTEEATLRQREYFSGTVVHDEMAHFSEQVAALAKEAMQRCVAALPVTPSWLPDPPNPIRWSNYTGKAIDVIKAAYGMTPKCECGSGCNTIGPGHSSWCKCFSSK